MLNSFVKTVILNLRIFLILELFSLKPHFDTKGQRQVPMEIYGRGKVKLL